VTGSDLLAALDPLVTLGVLVPGDAHLAASLCRLAGESDPDVALAVALASRAPRWGHVHVDLALVRAEVVAEHEVPADHEPVPWPEPTDWAERVARSPVVTATDAAVVADGGRVALARLDRAERAVAAAVLARAAVRSTAAGTAPTPIADRVLTGPGSDRQRAAVVASLERGLTVVVGGPGTGKTTTLAALVAELVESGRGEAVALAAPTGKAAARLGEAFRGAVAALPAGSAGLAERLGAVEPTTIHRLLGRGHDGHRFAHHVGRPLIHDVVIVDETSMVSVSLMADLLDAVRPDATLVLVGDPNQLASIGAGTVLGDLCVPPHGASSHPLEPCIHRLVHSRRFPPTSPVAAVAEAIERGDADAVVETLRVAAASPPDAPGRIRWVATGGDDPTAVDAVRAVVEPVALALHAAARRGDVAAALAGLEQVRILCAHRRGRTGVEGWNRAVEAWLRHHGVATTGWYVGRPVMVTANDYRLGRFNGDQGVVVSAAADSTSLRRRHVEVVFDDVGGPAVVRPSQLGEVETVHATTIHKSQGSEFDRVVVVLPPPGSRLMSRELLYTAVTRARTEVVLVADEAMVRAAVERRVIRHGSLAELVRAR
jgi:exodeoxyribonuclease V alpha subunit